MDTGAIDERSRGTSKGCGCGCSKPAPGSQGGDASPYDGDIEAALMEMEAGDTAAMVEDGHDLMTHGGGSMESVPGFNPLASMVEGIGTTEAFPLPTGFENAFDAGDAHFRRNPMAETVCGTTDERTRVETVTAPPWRMIAKLLITAGNGKSYVGTGWFISPRTLMTAGHCVFSRHSGGWARSIEVIPGMDSRLRPYGSATSTVFRSVGKWQQDDDPVFDYGCLVLPEGDRLGDRTGWFGFSSEPDHLLRNLLVNTAGYPGDKSFGTQWYNGGRVTNVHPGQLEYMIDTYGGQSGSPVWRFNSATKKRHVVGIHNYGGCDNKASRVTGTLFKTMQKWKAMGA